MTTLDHDTPRPARLGKAVWAQALRDYAHLSDADLAKLLRVSVQTVDYHRRKGSPRTKPPKPPKVPKKPAPTRYDWDEILRVYAHLNGQEIADIVGCTRAAVSLARKQRGLSSPVDRRTDDDWRAIFASYPNGTSQEIAQNIVCSEDRVRQASWRLGIKTKRRAPPVKFTTEMVRPLVEQGLSNLKIAKTIGCHWTTVQRIRTKAGIPPGRKASITADILEPMVRAAAGIPGSYEIRRLARTRL